MRALGTPPPDWPQCLGLAEAGAICCDVGQVMKNLKREDKRLEFDCVDYTWLAKFK